MSIAEFLAIDPFDLINRYCHHAGERYLLAQRADGYCIFWDKACTIHPVKPRMCRRWPFIESVVTDATNWTIMAGLCPGMRTDVPLQRVRECVERILASEAPDWK
jgi:Fe-S-cluster containining protein